MSVTMQDWCLQSGAAVAACPRVGWVLQHRICASRIDTINWDEVFKHAARRRPPSALSTTQFTKDFHRRFQQVVVGQHWRQAVS
jgi:hypothetical protein